MFETEIFELFGSEIEVGVGEPWPPWLCPCMKDYFWISSLVSFLWEAVRMNLSLAMFQINKQSFLVTKS